MLRGLSTISFYADDLDAAKRWYTEVLGFEPYFARPGYVEFRIGDHDHELGIIDSRYAPPGATDGPAGAVVYWQTDDVAAAFERLLSLGGKEYDGPRERGAGFVTASVIDPFGNILGVMHNPNHVTLRG
jgi:predicted enzyme related to lactoylglutathione lyase